MSGPTTTPFITRDGSSTLFSLRYKAHYHSSFGAVTESEHVFVNAGLGAATHKNIWLLEVGFGTGLNAALAAAYAQANGISLHYQALELHPLPNPELDELNYPKLLPAPAAHFWNAIRIAQWGKSVNVSEGFSITKYNTDFVEWQPEAKYHVIFFDAFAPNDQPEMWTPTQFRKLFEALHPGGVLTTYCVKGLVKSALAGVGFRIERLPGPPGKRHILRARKD